MVTAIYLRAIGEFFVTILFLILLSLEGVLGWGVVAGEGVSGVVALRRRSACELPVRSDGHCVAERRSVGIVLVRQLL